MRPPRIAILVLFFAASLFLLCRSISSIRHPNPVVTSSSSPRKSSLGAFFSFTAPFSLFPPSAAISLTDDNSTFFAARPAAFGPPLPPKGLSGQLWVGSGFSDETFQEGEGEGELGCSDIPGWEDGRLRVAIKAAMHGVSSNSHSRVTKGLKIDDLEKDPALKAHSHIEAKRLDDGTDDHLHQAVTQSRNPYSKDEPSSRTSHADIQSMQETAEITGKVALLSRGGCGFLEKVKWAQRRGAIALIVGDNQRGGPLIQMFARGNVDNVTIPSVFTSRTTAHLLSSLLQPGSYIEDVIAEKGEYLKVRHSPKVRQNGRGKPLLPGRRVSSAPAAVAPAREHVVSNPNKPFTVKRGVFSRLFHWGATHEISPDSNRPPSSGRLDWLSAKDLNGGNGAAPKGSQGKAAQSMGSPRENGDGFQIGVQDWRDPAFARPASGSDEASKSETTGNDKGRASGTGPRGGIVKPSSGEYLSSPIAGSTSSGPGNSKVDNQYGGILSKIFGNDNPKDGETDKGPNEKPYSATAQSAPVSPPAGGGGHRREGLWVTITPTGSASPFFDTLLVLVISPLITLTVVYALLILRVKIRMRRWRAPKSVVDRLPVRTYHTVAPSPSPSPRAPSPASPSPTTPLLQGTSRAYTEAPTTDIVESEDSGSSSTLQNPRQTGRGKDLRGISSEWRKHMSRQVECVVCLEEYIDGVSRVMSLPCGHEFHVECITPWLTTRRRTCPICKNDVVRSLARGTSSGPHYEPFREDSYESNDEGSSDTYEEERVPSPNQLEDDLERGPSFTQSSRPGWRVNRNDVWYSVLSGRFGGTSSFPASRESSEEDHHR
ncbi:hypothetical protein B0J18DRAFT_90964 [Chaetomium sp. MPI-SDFR-AT-0129]|nr:hypothetical protein B0J18DRAFT_90964 [Chaetomium sp. MPI-SDFR-AT-0129]